MTRPSWLAFLIVCASAVLAGWRLGDVKGRLARAARILDEEEETLLDGDMRAGFRLARLRFRDAWHGAA